MLDQGLGINFAHRTFKWSNEAPGRAAVHCVIVGFGLDDRKPRRLFEYPDIEKPPVEMRATTINPYLVDAPNVVLPSRKQPLSSDMPAISFGSMPNDGGHLLLTDAEKTELVRAERAVRPWVKRFLGADEFINGKSRWCLWLKGCAPDQLRRLPLTAARVAEVRKYRLASTRLATRCLADLPSLFGEDRQPSMGYVLIPCHSSERRAFIPMAFLGPDVVCGNANLCLPGASLMHFGVLSSTMHNAWVRYTCGRLKSDFRYSAGIVYNNFPWPLTREDRHVQAIEVGAQRVLDARAAHLDATLADLYDPNSMPPNLVQAHRELDRAVNAAYLAQLPPGLAKKPALETDAQRVALLFALYQHLAEPMAA